MRADSTDPGSGPAKSRLDALLGGAL